MDTAVYGPFPIRWKWLGFALVAAILGLMVLEVGGAVRRLQCERAAAGGGGAGVCALVTTSPLMGQRGIEFPADSVHDVRVIRHKTKQGVRGEVELIDAQGHSRHLGREELDDANRHAAQARRFFLVPRGEAGPPFFSMQSGSNAMSYMSVVPFLVALFLLWTTLRDAGRVELTRVALGRELLVVHRLGPLRLNARRVVLAEGTQVVVRTGPIAFAMTKGEQTGQRLELQAPDGALQPLFPRFRAEDRGQWRAAVQRLFGGEGGGEGSIDGALLPIAADPAPAEPRPEAPGRAIKRMLASPLVRLAIGVSFLGVVASLAIPLLTKNQGWLELRCVHRCRFGGAECLPGGHSKQALDPGTYVIEVWNPAVDGKWERHEVELGADQHVKFVCRQTALRSFPDMTR